MLQTPNPWSKTDNSRDYGKHREQSTPDWQINQNNNSELKNNDQSKQEDDSKESPKLTMKTWNSLTSDPATWPFKLPGAKPWPKDENGHTYNPNADLVRKLGLYKNGRLRPDKDLKQQKLQKSDKQANSNTWTEPDEQQAAWYNSHGNHWPKEQPSNGVWPAKWKQFAYHKVTAQPTSKSGQLSLDQKPKNAFIAVSAVSSPRYSNDWRKNDIEEIGQMGSSGDGTDDSEHPSSQMRMNMWKKSGGVNGTTSILEKAQRIDVLENQLENLKEKEAPVLVS